MIRTQVRPRALPLDLPAAEARIAGMAIAVPPVRATIEEVVEALGRVRGRQLRSPGLRKGDTRYFARPLSYIMQSRSVSQQTLAYLEHARVLARDACSGALSRSGIDPDTIGMVIGVSCTGVVLPSLDAELIPILGLRPDVARLPITELGCGGGVAGLARASDYLRAYPERAVLLFSVELPSLTYQPDDRSVDNLVAALVFGDGAGAAVLQTETAGPSWAVERSGTLLVPEGAPYLGYELRDGGLHVVLSRDLPAVVETHLAEAVDAFLALSGLGRADVDVLAAHPGGPGIFDAIQRALGLDPEALETSRMVFARYGNASSAGIFFVLSGLRPAGIDTRALALAFGPGLSIELALLRFNE